MWLVIAWAILLIAFLGWVAFEQWRALNITAKETTDA